MANDRTQCARIARFRHDQALTVVGLIESLSPPNQLAIVARCGIGKFPANGRFGCRAQDKGVFGGGIEIAREQHIRLGISDRGWGDARGRHIPAHFNQPGVVGRRGGLVGPLPLDGHDGAGGHIMVIGPGENVGGNGIGEVEDHIPRNVGRARIVHGVDGYTRIHIRIIHHDIVAGLGMEAGGAIDGDLGIGQASSADDLANGADRVPVSQAGITGARGDGPVRAAILRHLEGSGSTGDVRHR